MRQLPLSSQEKLYHDHIGHAVQNIINIRIGKKYISSLEYKGKLQLSMLLSDCHLLGSDYWARNYYFPWVA